MKFHFYSQLDAMDCGAACLQMIAKFYGKGYSLEVLKNKCHTTRDGVSLLDISNVAEEIGFKTYGGKITFKQLCDEVPLPCIVHWNQEHFIVVYKIRTFGLMSKKTNVYVADPSFGLITYTEQEFKVGWISTWNHYNELGIVLIIEPTKNFGTQEILLKERSSLKFIYSYILVYKKLFLQLLLGLLLSSVLQLIFPFLTQSIIDVGIKDHNLSFIYIVLIAQLSLVIGRTSIDFIRRWILFHISTRINISLLSDFFIKLFKLPMQYFDVRLVGDIIQRIKDHERIESFLTSQTLNVLFSFFNILVFGIVLFIYNIKIFSIFIFGSVLYVLWISLFLSRRKVLDYKIFDQKSRNYSKTYQLINGMQEIKLQNCEKRKRWEWEDIQSEIFSLSSISLRLEQYQEAGNIVINETKNIVITILSATAVLNGELTLGMMLAIQYIIGQLNSPIEQTVNFIHNLQDTRISLERINEIHQKEDENVGRMNNQTPIINSDFYIRNLTFQYEGSESPKVLNNINLKIPKGKVTALVGTSGSGKTTLIKLLLQYYKPTKGDIFIGEFNLNIFNTVTWRNKCGAVMQDGFIFSESIAHNIAVGDNKINKERLIVAAKAANIHDYIISLPLKYNTIIGQEGQGISQGQKQRILIARAIYKDPDFIFLDEATNALDSKNEKIIVGNLEHLSKGKTVIIVAHRLSTVKNADQIVVLDKGAIAEIGNHIELTNKRGLYYSLVKNQLELGN